MFTLGNRELSPRQRLTLMTMLTSGIGLILICAGFVYHDLREFRAKKAHDIAATADLLSAIANVALAFDDSSAGEQTLEAMRAYPGIRTAILYQADGRLSAWYLRRDLTGNFKPPERPSNGLVWARDFVSFTETVELEGKPVGTLYLEADLSDLHGRKAHIGWTWAVTSLVCLLIV